MRRIIVPRRPGWALVVSVARRIPFTLVVVISILVVTATTGSLVRPLAEDAYRFWGYGFDTIEEGRWETLFLTIVQASRPDVVLAITASLLLMLGASEYLVGTVRAVIVFFTGHIVGYVGADLLLSGLISAGMSDALPLIQQYDVGASAAAFGAAGAALPFLPSRMRNVAFALIVLYLMLLLLTSRAIWDVGHVLAFPTGLALGVLFLRQRGSEWPALVSFPRFPRWQRPLLIGWLVAVMGFVNILSTFVSPQREGMRWLEEAAPLVVMHGSRHLTLLLGFALLVLAWGLSRGKRQAWYFTVLALFVSGLLHLLKGGDLLEAMIAFGLLLLLLAWRMSFVAQADPPSRREGYRAALAVVVLLPLYGVVGFFLLQEQFDASFRVPNALRETVSRVIFTDAGLYEPTSQRAGWFLGSIPVLGWAGVLYALAMLVRGTAASPPTADDVERARQLVSAYGESHSSSMTLWEGNMYFLACGRQVCICYRVEADVALALGDPIGPAQLIEQSIYEFAAFCQECGWDVAFFAASQRVLERYKRLGYHAVKVGEEAVIPLADLTLRGKRWQDFRTALNRATRDGITFHMYEGGNVPEEVREQIFEISQEWVGDTGLPEMSFTLGTAGDIDDPNVYVTTAEDEGGCVHAFSNWLPLYRANGWVIDLMRCRGDAFDGAMEFLIISSLLAFKERGHRVASLSLTPLANVSRDADESLIQRVLGILYERFSSAYHFQSLFNFKKKFQPRWQGGYLIFENHTDLPRIALALLRAHLPGLKTQMIAEIVGSSLARRMDAARQRADTSEAAS